MVERAKNKFVTILYLTSNTQEGYFKVKSKGEVIARNQRDNITIKRVLAGVFIDGAVA